MDAKTAELLFLLKRYVSNIISTQAFSATEMIAAMAEVRGTRGCGDFT
jgi:hypothetical protein